MWALWLLAGLLAGCGWFDSSTSGNAGRLTGPKITVHCAAETTRALADTTTTVICPPPP
jgi:hypothetical protein